ncbi:predicted protein [Lichtheimia corymbifera JMRC:FSU:9682]|uniref:Secreted protein n=1 Tax=Lichtheimia corymbifera JMRC:FSU:9682 TaxID=1263082 RepID=A0A068RNY1_9FUNG|nr:predicted protein [Lichtheimia corymbifera JMRC:FSU:9682]
MLSLLWLYIPSPLFCCFFKALLLACVDCCVYDVGFNAMMQLEPGSISFGGWKSRFQPRILHTRSPITNAGSLMEGDQATLPDFWVKQALG